MDRYSQGKLERMLSGPIPPAVETMYDKVQSLVQKTGGPSHFSDPLLALVVVLSTSEAPETPEGAKDALNKEDTGKHIIVQIGDEEVVAVYQGRGPGGRYRVALEDKTVRLVPKESFVGYAQTATN